MKTYAHKMNMFASKTSERGQTLALVAVSLASLIALGALAIDLTTLYVARGEMQRAADAAALATGKAFVESGTTTAPNNTNLQGLARTIGNAYVTSIIQLNKVGGVAPTLVGGVNYDFSRRGNPQATVTLERTDLPTFFAHIFGVRTATVRATAIAEAYNSSEPPGGGVANMPPVAPSCVKPWLIPNSDPRHSNQPFINETDGTLTNPDIYPTGVIGEEIVLNNPCVGGICAVGLLTPIVASPPNILPYLPARVANAAPATSCITSTNFELAVSSCDSADSYACGGTAPPLLFDLASGLLDKTVTSVECLIGATATGTRAGQDEIGLGPGADGPANQFGNFLASNGNDPIEIVANSGPHSGSQVNTSHSVVTLPIYATAGLNGVTALLAQVHVIGFMQAFVEQAPNSGGQVEIYVLNISGCGPNVNTAANPVVGGGASPVPVRLIRQ